MQWLTDIYSWLNLKKIFLLFKVKTRSKIQLVLGHSTQRF